MTKISKIRNERGEIITDTTEIQRLIRNYYGQLYNKKFENLDEMHKFLVIYTSKTESRRSRKPE